jgi:hypothetical protein
VINPAGWKDQEDRERVKGRRGVRERGGESSKSKESLGKRQRANGSGPGLERRRGR